MNYLDLWIADLRQRNSVRLRKQSPLWAIGKSISDLAPNLREW
jgi:hypothetical protein